MSAKMRKSLLFLTLGLLISCSDQTSEQHIEQAQEYIAQQNNAAAIVSLKNAVQQAPKSAEARFELGKVYLAEKQYENAEKELNRAQEYGYEPAKVTLLLTRAHQHTGAYAALSEVDYNLPGLSADEQAEIGYFKVVALIRLGKTEEALLLIDELAALDTTSVYKGLTASYPAILDRDAGAALTQLEQVRETEPTNPELLKLAAQLHLSEGNPQAAADEFEHYVTLYPEDVQTTFVLAKLLTDLGKTAEAEPYIDKLLAINSSNGLLNQLKAAARGAAKDYPQTQKYAELAIQNGITDPSIRLIAGYAAYQQQDFTAASQHLSMIASVLPDEHPGLRLLAASQLQLGLNSEASDVLGRLEHLSPEDAPLFSKASYELLRSGNVKDAKELVEKSSAISTSAEDLTRLGLLQLSLNNLDGIVNLEEALDKSPQLASAQTTLATAYLATKQYDKALELASSWKQQDPQDIRAYLLAGEVYSQQKQYPQAEQEFEQLLEIEPQHQAAALGLVNLNITQGKAEKAQQQLQALLAAHPTYVPALATYYMVSRKNGDPATGVKFVENIHNANSDNAKVTILLAHIYILEEQYQQALGQLATLDSMEFPPAGYWQSKGHALIRTNQRKAAHEHYDKWLAIQPNKKEAVIGKLLLLDNENKFDEALALTEGFLGNRDDLQMQLLNTHFLLMSKDYVRGREAYNALPDNLKDLPLAKGFLARLQLLDKNLPMALENAKVAYESVGSSRNLVLLVYIYEQLGKDVEGKTLIEQHVASHPDDLAALMLLAERQISLSSKDAMGTYEKIIELSANNFIAHNNLAYLYLQNDNSQKAKLHATQAVKLQPDNAAAVDTLAQVLVADENYDEAVKYYETVVDDKMQNEEIYLNYVEALFLADNNVLAKRKLGERTMSSKQSKTRLAELKTKFNP
ncbi:MAG: putative PEP-CTERM system TPR-repeat lipoprotein [Paraglaciecola sp.]|jgi:putative PEP-CTERM system TPR-repeat lipoprotein